MSIRNCASLFTAISAITSATPYQQFGTTLPLTNALADDDVAALNARIDSLQADADALAYSAATKQELGLPVHGFANVNCVHDTQHENDRKDGFALGNFDLYMLPSFGSRVRGLVELNF